MLMLSSLNCHFAQGSKCASCRRLFGPPMPTQRSLNPQGIRDLNWERELKRAKVSYCGEEFEVAEQVALRQVEAGLPAQGVAAQIPLEFVLEGYTLHQIRHPAEVREPDEEVTMSWPRSRFHARSPDEEYKVKTALVERGIARVAPKSLCWRVMNRRICSGFFGVIKSKCKDVDPYDEEIVRVLRAIWNLIPSGACQYMTSGDIRQLPNVQQWGLAHLEVLEVRLITIRGRASVFNIFLYSISMAWWFCACRWRATWAA